MAIFTYFIYYFRNLDYITESGVTPFFPTLNYNLTTRSPTQ